MRPFRRRPAEPARVARITPAVAYDGDRTLRELRAKLAADSRAYADAQAASWAERIVAGRRAAPGR